MPMNSQFTDTITTKDGEITFYSLKKLEEQGYFTLKNTPYSIRVLIESILRQEDDFLITAEDVKNVTSWNPEGNADVDVPFIPARVILQDFTGVPAVVDLAAMRSAVAALGKDPAQINPLIPVDLVIDHSIQVDHAGTPDAQELNEKIEFNRNAERYTLLKLSLIHI